MAAKSQNTRTDIIKSARSEFFTHGYEGARLQSIADQIGVTKAMIHYYFNTKKELFERVYSQSVNEVFGGLNSIIDRDIPLFKKIEELIEACLSNAEKNPEVLAFVITEAGRKPEWLQPVFEEQLELELASFEDELNEAASNYQIAAVDPQNLLLNIFSLCYYPALSATVNQPLLNTRSKNGSPANRKGIILDTILNWLTA